MTRRFWIAALLGAPVFVVDDGATWSVARAWLMRGIGVDATGSASCFATPVVFWAGWPFFERGWASIVNRSPNMFTLIALGVGAAYVYSVVGDARARSCFRTASACTASSRPYFDTAVVITVLVLLGQVLELRARSRTSAAIRAAARPGAEDGARRSRRRTSVDVPLARGARSAICCASGPARRCRSTASSSRDAARSTSRW